MQYFVFIAECETHENVLSVNDFAFFEVKPRIKMFDLSGSAYKRFIPYIIAGEYATFYEEFKHGFNWDYSEQIFFINDSHFYIMRVFEWAENAHHEWRMDAETALLFAQQAYLRFI